MSEENKQETVAGIVAEMRRESDNRMEDESCYTECALLRDYADRIEAAAEREDALWRAALAKVSSVVTRHYARSNLGEQGHRAVAEIMSACRFPDGALDEYARSFAERDRLRAALKPVLECKVMSAMTAEIEVGRSDYCANIIEQAQRIYNEGETKWKKSESEEANARS